VCNLKRGEDIAIHTANKGIHRIHGLAAAGTIGYAFSRGKAGIRCWQMTLLLAGGGHLADESDYSGINGSMSVNCRSCYVVIMLSAAESNFDLSACACGVMQTLPKDGSKVKLVRVLFNVSMMAFSCGAAGLPVSICRY